MVDLIHFKFRLSFLQVEFELLLNEVEVSLSYVWQSLNRKGLGRTIAVYHNSRKTIGLHVHLDTVEQFAMAEVQKLEKQYKLCNLKQPMLLKLTFIWCRHSGHK